MMWPLVVLMHALIVPADTITLCSDVKTTRDREECLEKELAKVERILSSQERLVRSRVDNKIIPLFDSTTRTWKMYRDQECRLEYRFVGSASIAGTDFLYCKIDLTNDRISLLRNLLDPTRR